VTQPLLHLPTERAGVHLKELTVEANGQEFSDLVYANFLHLRQHGGQPESLSDEYESPEGYLKMGQVTEGVIEMGIFDQATLVGFIALLTSDLVVPKGSAEVGYWLGSAYTGKGRATAAVRALSAYAKPRYFPVFAQVTRTNQKSINVLERAGYKRTGINEEGKLVFELPKDS